MTTETKRPEAWAAENARNIDQRIIVEGDLVLETPTHFGAGGSDDLTDMPLLVDAADGVTPLLTGATLAGVLRAYLYQRERGYRAQALDNGAGHSTLTYALFGAFKGDDEGVQSPLIVDDAFGREAKIELRDGVKIRSDSRTAYDKGLFDMELWAAGTTFPLRFELDITSPRGESSHEIEGQMSRRALLIALQGLTDGSITLGARKRRGFGRARVSKWRVKAYDMHDASQLCDWIENGHLPLEEQGIKTLTDLATHEQFKDLDNTQVDNREWFELDATFELDGSLLIRSNGEAEVRDAQKQSFAARPDMVHLHNRAGEAVLPGTSLAGALRARATKILGIFFTVDEVQARIDEIFGSDLHKEDSYEQRPDAPEASLLTVEEHPVAGRDDLVQNRVAIDRFTGGARDTALFSEQPVWGDGATDGVRVKLRLVRPVEMTSLRFREHIGLLLLLLKDLWTGDLPLGGEISVGRGRLKGTQATLHYRRAREDDDEGAYVTDKWQIKRAGEGLAVDEETRKALEKFVDALHGRETEGDE